MLYFTSDLHFFHDNVIKYANRPFQNAAEMNEALIKNWNQKVKPADEVYLLGDLTMKGASTAAELLRLLNGRKYLVKGNHDRFADQKEFPKDAFVWIKDYYELSCQEHNFILLHYPLEEWNGMFRGAFHLHGHQHNHADYNLQNRMRGVLRYDVGVDANCMMPVSLEEILSFFAGED